MFGSRGRAAAVNRVQLFCGKVPHVTGEDEPASRPFRSAAVLLLNRVDDACLDLGFFGAHPRFLLRDAILHAPMAGWCHAHGPLLC